MQEKQLQIVAFNNPYPPDFGGAIDIYYKIQALYKLGVKIHLHIFYDDRKDVTGLSPLCESINLYKKNKSLIKHFSLLPYCVKARLSKDLIINLNKIDAPILFESIRTTGVLKNKQFKLKTAVRCHNIEHCYSWGLFKSEPNWFKKIAYFLEGYKLKYYESILNKVDILFTLSNYEQSYYNKYFKNTAIYLPVFQGYNKFKGKKGFGKYALYHGDLSISDNIKSAFFIINVFKDLNELLIIASSTKNTSLINETKKYKNISFELITNGKQLNNLIENAHINTLYSFQKSGTKLKVFSALFNGRHCILNSNMIDDPDILNTCVVAENKIDYQNAVRHLFKKEFTISQELKNALKMYDSQRNASLLIEVLF